MMQSSPRNDPKGLVLPWPPFPIKITLNKIFVKNILLTVKMEDNRHLLTSGGGGNSNKSSSEHYKYKLKI